MDTDYFDPIGLKEMERVSLMNRIDRKYWFHVGIRFKGNSSLRSAYKQGNNTLSFKLDFDLRYLL